MSSFLQKYQRQPKLYVDLPSQGAFYNEDTIQDNTVTKMPVFGMNAMDEIIFKTPDALLTGEATASVMQSCIPYIKDPWQLVGYDIDFILIAMRIATYGDGLPISTRCPHCSTEQDSEVSLTRMLDNFVDYPIKFQFHLDNLTVHLRPLTYRETTDFSMENFALERRLVAIKTSDSDEKTKDEQVKTIFSESSKLNLRLAVAHIESISEGDNIEADNNVVLEFIQNSDQEFYKKLRDGIKDLTEKWNLPNIKIKCVNEECDADEYSTNIDLDYSNFFGARSLHSRNLI